MKLYTYQLYYLVLANIAELFHKFAATWWRRDVYFHADEFRPFIAGKSTAAHQISTIFSLGDFELQSRVQFSFF